MRSIQSDGLTYSRLKTFDESVVSHVTAGFPMEEKSCCHGEKKRATEQTRLRGQELTASRLCWMLLVSQAGLRCDVICK